MEKAKKKQILTDKEMDKRLVAYITKNRFAMGPTGKIYDTIPVREAIIVITGEIERLLLFEKDVNGGMIAATAIKTLLNNAKTA